MAEGIRNSVCIHAENYKKYSWQSQKFSDKFSTQYEYCYCQICKNSVYTGLYQMVVNHPNLDTLTNKKEHIMNRKSVSRALKNRHEKEGKNLSLKEFVRQLINLHDEMANVWLQNKSGVLNESKSDTVKKRILLEKSATKLARKSKRGPKAASVKADK